ncbi:ATP synthase F0 subcomplex A subunit [Anaerovirgula multivorans]|uniref:ATP synthase subunit a n=1 Tax=Anaerovirgula multivorans TaxID=312168 RepID=A0A239EZZ9_9FIRM|nr:F0F1 ATP synthase subunit A [Anaerovirgula multivorans]SNS50209.1 ATP synthase F0 subcomplex A subunit [Anaerovirgula multivorans]
MEFGPKVIFEIGGIPVTETVINTWIIMLVLTVLAMIGGSAFKKIPRGRQNVVEVIVDAINKLTIQTMGEDKKFFASYMGTLFLFLLCANLLGLLGLRPPTADVNTTFALSTLTFILIHFYGAKRKGTGTYLKGFLEPFPLLLPMNIISELAFPVSLSFRLFGNIVGGLIIMSLLYGSLIGLSSMVGLGAFPILQAGIPLVFHLYFDIFSGVLHTFIFMMLSMVFISIAMD